MIPGELAILKADVLILQLARCYSFVGHIDLVPYHCHILAFLDPMSVGLLSSIALSFPFSEVGAEVALDLISKLWRPLPSAMFTTIPSLKLPTTTSFLP